MSAVRLKEPAEGVAVNVDGSVQVVAFEISGRAFAVDLARVNSIVMPQATTPIADAPSYVAGVIELRGRAITVLDLRARFGLTATSAEPRGQQRILVVESGGAVAGVLADAVCEVLSLPLSRVTPATGQMFPLAAELIRGIASDDDKRRLLLLDVAEMLNDSCARGSIRTAPRAKRRRAA